MKQDPPRTRDICVPCRLAAIGAVVLGLAGSFAYVANWLAPRALSAPHIIDTFEAVGGIHAGFRRNHAKGLCVEGHFDSNGNGSELSVADVFAPGRSTPVVGRFAIPGSNPSAPDASVPVRSFALDYQLHNGEQWHTGMNSTPVFAVGTPAEFYEQLVASRPDPATHKPDPAKLAAFFAAHPDTAPFRAWVKNHAPSSSFTNAAYYSIDAFRFTDAQGATHAVRWSVEPELPYAPQSAEQKADPDFLDADLAQRLKNGPLHWHLILTVAAPGDPTNDATRAWPDDRRRIDAGTLVIERATPQEGGACRDINYDPTILPTGIAPSDDPLLAARSAAYAVSYQRRTREVAAQHAAPASRQGEGS